VTFRCTRCGRETVEGGCDFCGEVGKPDAFEVEKRRAEWLSERDQTVGRLLPKETGTPGEVATQPSRSESFHDDEDAYEPDDPKHPSYHEQYAAYADVERKRMKEEGP
jgi:hypothetical protein